MVAAPLLDPTRVRVELGLSRERMGRLLDVTGKTIERWEKASALPASLRQRQLLLQLLEIATLGQVVYTPAGFRRFLATPLPVFAGRTALQVIEADQADLVLAALAADYEAVAS